MPETAERAALGVLVQLHSWIVCRHVRHRHMDEQGAAVVGFICVAGSEGGHQPSQAKMMAQLYQRFGPRQTDFVVRVTKKPDGTWDTGAWTSC